MNDDHGAVHVSVADDNKITVMVRKRVGAESQNDADKYNQQTKPADHYSPATRWSWTPRPRPGDHSVQSDLDISIPRKMGLHITGTQRRRFRHRARWQVEIAAQHGDVSVEDINGNVKLNLEKSSAKVEQVTGDVHIDGRLNEVSVMDVKGSVQLDGEFEESVKLARISKNVGFKSSRTDMEFSRIDGELDLDSDDLHADKIAGPSV